MRHYVYISRNKLDTYYPQAGKSVKSTEITASLGVGVAKAEFGQKYESAGSDHQRLEVVLKSLEATGDIGTVARPRQFFGGRIRASLLIFRNMAFYGGYVKSDEGDTCVGLTCSVGNMLGYGFQKAQNDSPQQLPSIEIEHFVLTSSNVAFAHTLLNILSRGEPISPPVPAMAHNVPPVLYELTADEERLVTELAALNYLMLLVHPPLTQDHRVRVSMLAPVVDRVLSLPKGRAWYDRKLAALQKQVRLRAENMVPVPASEDEETLRAVADATRGLSASARDYEYVALRMLEGVVGGKRVLLGSPLFMAILY